jgi:retron-type reverse transcriptase
LDRRLSGFAKRHALNYTRYADDLSFSGEMDRVAAGGFRTTVSRIVSEEGFVINAEKTRLMGQGGRQTVTGVVVNQTLGLSRQERRRWRAALHQIRNQADADGTHRASLEGKIAYLAMLNARQAAQLEAANE